MSNTHPASSASTYRLNTWPTINLTDSGPEYLRQAPIGRGQRIVWPDRLGDDAACRAVVRGLAAGYPTINATALGKMIADLAGPDASVEDRQAWARLILDVRREMHGRPAKTTRPASAKRAAKSVPMAAPAAKTTPTAAASQLAAARRRAVRPVCPEHFIHLPLAGPCDMCADGHTSALADAAAAADYALADA